MSPPRVAVRGSRARAAPALAMRSSSSPSSGASTAKAASGASASTAYAAVHEVASTSTPKATGRRHAADRDQRVLKAHRRARAGEARDLGGGGEGQAVPAHRRDGREGQQRVQQDARPGGERADRGQQRGVARGDAAHRRDPQALAIRAPPGDDAHERADDLQHAQRGRRARRADVARVVQEEDDEAEHRGLGADEQRPPAPRRQRRASRVGGGVASAGRRSGARRRVAHEHQRGDRGGDAQPGEGDEGRLQPVGVDQGRERQRGQRAAERQRHLADAEGEAALAAREPPHDRAARGAGRAGAEHAGDEQRASSAA